MLRRTVFQAGTEFVLSHVSVTVIFDVCKCYMDICEIQLLKPLTAGKIKPRKSRFYVDLNVSVFAGRMKEE